VKVIRDLARLPVEARGGAVAIGNFDGVHRGHARIVDQLRQQAGRLGGLAVVFTFDPHPVRLLRPEQCPPPLTWTERKAELLEELGVDCMIAYPTDEAMLNLAPRDFFDRFVVEQLDARAMVEGPNFYFGHNRAGTIDLLRRLTEEVGIGLSVVQPYLCGGEPVSSSRIRALVSAGQVREARGMLTQPYRIRGMVTHGVGRGAKIGFPTANLHAIDTLLPGAGVYAGRAWLDGKAISAAINIGTNPTFDESQNKVEAHLIGWSEPLYGKALELDFWERLRDIRRFASAAQLEKKLAEDVEQTKGMIGST